MIESARGIIMRTRPLTETSLIIHWLTPELGRLATVAKGARRPKSPFAGKLDLFYTADFAFSRSRSSELHHLREVKLLQPRSGIREELERLQLAAYATAFVEQTTETETPLPEIFAFTASFFDWLCMNQPKLTSLFALELKLLALLGMEPELDKTHLTMGARRIAVSLATEDWDASARLKPSEAQTSEIRQWLHGFLIFHLGRLPRGRSGILAIGS